MPKKRQVAASISTKGEAVGSGDGANGRAKEIESKKCNLGGTSKLSEHKESGAAAQKQHKGEENPKATAEEEYGENMWGTIASAAFSNPTSAMGECDWLTLHRRMGHVALPILQQLAGSRTVPNVRVGDTKVMDTLEGRLEDVRRRHEAQEYGVIPWAVIEAGLCSVWAAKHPPSRPASPRPVTNEGGVNVGVKAGGDQVGSSAGGMSMQRGVIHADEVGDVQMRGMRSTAAAGTSQGDVRGRRSGLTPMSATQVTAGGIAPSYGYFKFTLDRILVTPPLVGRPDILTWKEAIEPQLKMAGLIGFARGTVATPEEHHADLRAEFRAVQLLTFTVISRCCSPGVQIALKWCREYLDAGHRAWHFIESTYQVTDDLFIAQLEGQLTHLHMGDEETATDYCNRARRILATIRMAGAQYSTASYVTHVMQGLSSSYNLLKRLSMAPSVVPKYYSGTVIALPFNLQACSASGILWGGASTFLCHVVQVVTEFQDNPASEQHVTAVESYCSVVMVHCFTT
ncbi:unnamed protein product [Closterium sp. NIES-54]